MTKQYDVVVYIGRFQPPHIGHIATLKRALEIADKVICLIGSSYSPRNTINPFTAAERQEVLLLACLNGKVSAKELYFERLHDYLYSDNGWIVEVQQLVAKHTTPDDKIGLIGLDKGNSTKYLKWFPQWDLVPFSEVELRGIDATTIRELLFKENNLNFVKSVVPPETFHFLERIAGTAAWKMLCEEYRFIEKYKSGWSSAPYPPFFVTADAVVVQDGHILLVKRKSFPGKGLLALPGGFVQYDEQIEAAAIRELQEETKIRVPPAVLRGSIKRASVFDSPVRSLRGRTITHAFFIELPSTGALPKVSGSDDAEKAFWLPISEVDELKMFEDHFHIISYFVK